MLDGLFVPTSQMDHVPLIGRLESSIQLRAAQQPEKITLKVTKAVVPVEF
jgi:hypothetical protein